MSQMPDRFVAWHRDKCRDCPVWRNTDIGPGGTEYVRADLYEAAQSRVQFLEKALDQAIDIKQWKTMPHGNIAVHDVVFEESEFPELAAYLKEKKEDA